MRYLTRSYVEALDLDKDWLPYPFSVFVSPEAAKFQQARSLQHEGHTYVESDCQLSWDRVE